MNLFDQRIHGPHNFVLNGLVLSKIKSVFTAKNAEPGLRLKNVRLKRGLGKSGDCLYCTHHNVHNPFLHTATVPVPDQQTTSHPFSFSSTGFPLPTGLITQFYC